MAERLPTDNPIDPELRTRRYVRGSKPGSRYVQIVRPFARDFRPAGENHLVATERALRPRGAFAGALDALHRFLVGNRIASELALHERVGILKGLAIFASDNISSSAYATEEIMRVLVLAGTGALVLTMPLTLGIVLVLAVVVMSYQQTIRAYPNGGGSYVVASDNLGRLPGLVAAGALLTDYVLTVAVSIAAGVAALTSIFPGLYEHRVTLGVAFIGLLWVGNLRGIRESGTIFAIPTYAYLLSVVALLGYGVWLAIGGNLAAYQAPAEWLEVEGAQALGILLILRAFTSGAVALTGTEAVANGVTAFRDPDWRNARVVLLMMGSIFAVVFLGISFLAGQLGIVPDPSEERTVISQLAATLVGDGSAFHYVIQVATALVLVLAANTAFNGFPLLAGILGRDRYLPRQFQFRGDRLAYSVGIGVLALIAAALLVGFRGSVTNLIPLYTVGVFVAFTLSQAGMVRHWQRIGGEQRGWWWRAALNALGAVATGVVAVFAGVSKFVLGAWVVLLLVPALVLMMVVIRRHYEAVESALAVDWSRAALGPVRPPRVIVPVARLDRAALAALRYARSMSDEVTAVHVTDDPREATEIKRRWRVGAPDVDLVILESPYRALVAPLLTYIDALDAQDPDRPTTVVLSEFVPRRFWEHLLHNQAALRLKLRLFFRRNTVVVDVPFHLR
ncbi:MAG TPA: APC family permease [Candidatus Limnocylindria bacterium]